MHPVPPLAPARTDGFEWRPAEAGPDRLLRPPGLRSQHAGRWNYHHQSAAALIGWAVNEPADAAVCELAGAAEAAADVAKPKATIIASTATILRRIERVTFVPFLSVRSPLLLDRQLCAMIMLRRY